MLKKMSMTENGIPVISLSYIDGNIKDLYDLSWELCNAAERTGFFYIKNHNIPDGVITSLEKNAKKFFSNCLTEKRKYSIENSPSHSGYVSFNDKGLYEDETGKRRYESFDITQDSEVDIREKSKGNIFNGPVPWPDDMFFYHAITNYFQHMLNLSNFIYSLIELGMDLPKNFFRHRTYSPLSQLRLIHYIKNKIPPNLSDMNMGAHTDYECFTILHQTEPGLQTQNIHGEWVEAPPIPGTFIVNIGDILEVLTNGKLKSNLHRVVNNNNERFSFPFFSSLDFDCVISPEVNIFNKDKIYDQLHVGKHVIGQISRDFSYLRNNTMEQIELPGENPYKHTVTIEK